MRLFQQGQFKLSSGQKTNWKIECDALDDGDWETLAMLISRRYGFGGVRGVATGGTKLAELLQPHIQQYNKNYLIVDDVYTTGTSMNRLRDKLVDAADGGNRCYLGVAVFARFPIRGHDSAWIKALFNME